MGLYAFNETWGVAKEVEQTGRQNERFLLKTALATAMILELKSTEVIKKAKL